MGVQTGKADGASEVCLRSLFDWVLVGIEVLFGKSEIYDVDLLKILTQNKIGSLDVTVDESSVVDFLNCL